MYSTEDIRFPIFETWPAELAFASQALEQRRAGLRLMTQLLPGLAGLAAAAVLARGLWHVQRLADVAALLLGLALGCVVATAIAGASLLSWRLRLNRLAARPGLRAAAPAAGVLRS
jgi:hypothetical protein